VENLTEVSIYHGGIKGIIDIENQKPQIAGGLIKLLMDYSVAKTIQYHHIHLDRSMITLS
jgi:hypothetical protein